MAVSDKSAPLPTPGGSDRISIRTYLSLVILAGIAGLNTVDRNMFGLLLPQIQQDLALSDTALGFLVGPAFVIVYSVAGVPLAVLADRTNRRNVIAAGLAFWSLMTIATGFAKNFGHLLAARMVLGVGEASNMAPTSALIADLFEGPRRVMAMAVFAAGGPFAIMLFYPLIGWISAEYGWRPAFPLMGAIGLVVGLLTFFVVREPSRKAKVAGSAERPAGLPEAARIAFTSPAFLLTCAGGTMLSINYSAMLAWLPTFLLREHGLDAQATGALLGTYKGLIGIGATLASGAMVAWLMRFDRRWLAWAPAGFCLLMAPAQVLLLIAETPLWWHIGLAAETILTNAITPVLFALVLALFQSRIRATGTAIFLLIFNLVGQSVGPVMVGLLTDGPFAAYGAGAIRYSLLSAPLCILIGAALLLALSFIMSRNGAEQ